MKLLILGGYGVFGGRLATLLSADTHTILIAGRSLAKATAFCTNPLWHPVQTDRATILHTLQTHRPDLLIDASGPFQDYGPDPYLVLKACIATSTPYLDFADGADFVNGVSALNEEARAAGIFALSGVSSFPVLTAAVLTEIAKTMDITEVTGGIAPSPYAGVGINVLRSVLGYAGNPVALVRNGHPATARGLAETRTFTIAPPGALPLRPTLFSLVDVPDLRALPAAMPGIKTLWMGAGPLPEPLHRALIALARLRARGILPNLAPLAPIAHRVLNALKYGEHRGGMFIEAHGTQNGHPATLSWHMLAEGDDGPFIPTMAIAALVARITSGQPPKPGARPAIGELTLADYDQLFATRAITTGWREPPTGPLYHRILGPAFATLPPTLQSLHHPGEHARWSGRATVIRGPSPLAALVARLFGFPKAGTDIPVSVAFRTAPDGTETWTRTFAGRPMISTQEPGTGPNQHLLTERFGPFAFGLALVTGDNRLRLVPRRWTFLGLPLPRALLPRGDSFETEQDGKFHFHVEIALPLLGPIVTYDGWLNPMT